MSSGFRVLSRLLITGASGFIGRSCLPLLIESGYEVHAISSTSQAARDGVVWHKVDLLDAENTAEIIARVSATHLLHLAWYAVPGKFWSAEVNRLWMSASMELFRNFAIHGGQRIVAAGSCAEYDWNYGLCTEGVTPLDPSTLYGKCKRQLFSDLEKFSAERKISMAWARIFFVYGPGEHRDRLVPSVILSLLNNRKALCSEGRQVRDFLYVRDAASALVMLLNSPVEGAVNIGSGEPVEIRHVARMIARELGKEDMLELGALPMSKGEPERLVADNSRLTDEVGWHPGYSLSDGLGQAIRWWGDKDGDSSA